MTMTPEEFKEKFLSRTSLASSSLPPSPTTTTTTTTTAITLPRGVEQEDNDDHASSSSSSSSKSQSSSLLCGRFMKGKTDEDFLQLSDEPGKLLSWVCSDQMLKSSLGLNPVDAMMRLGFRTEWIQCRLNEGTQFKLLVFPVQNNPQKGQQQQQQQQQHTSSFGSDNNMVTTKTVAVTWENLWQLIAQTYGNEIDQALGPFKVEIESLDTAAIGMYPFEGGQTICDISDLPVREKHAHPGFLSAANFLAIRKDERTLYHARGFLDHSVGCNHKFTGTGFSPAGEVEMMTVNRPIKDIPGAILIPLDVTQEDLDAAILEEERAKKTNQ